MTNEQDNLRIKHQKAHMYYKLCLAKRDKLIHNLSTLQSTIKQSEKTLKNIKADISRAAHVYNPRKSLKDKIGGLL